MPFNSEKTIKLGDFLDQVHQRLERENNQPVLSFFEIFLQKDLARLLVEKAGCSSDLSELELAPGDFDVIYPFAVDRLFDAASRNYSECHLDIYEEAHAVSVAFCTQLNEAFECSGDDGVFDLISVKSYLEMAKEAGMVTVVDGRVKLTPKGEEMVKRFESKIRAK